MQEKTSNISTIIILAATIIIGASAYWVTRPPNLSIYPPSFNFDVTGGIEPGYQVLSISNSGGSTLRWSVSTDQPQWIKVNPQYGTGSGAVTVYPVTSGMIPGMYSGMITVTSNGGTKTGTVYLNLVASQKSGDSQPSGEKKDLGVGGVWNIAGGWQIQANAIDAKAAPKQVWISLSKNGVKVDDRVLTEGETYNYNNILSVKIASIYSGPSTDMVTLTDLVYPEAR